MKLNIEIKKFKLSTKDCDNPYACLIEASKNEDLAELKFLIEEYQDYDTLQLNWLQFECVKLNRFKAASYLAAYLTGKTTSALNENELSLIERSGINNIIQNSDLQKMMQSSVDAALLFSVYNGDDFVLNSLTKSPGWPISQELNKLLLTSVKFNRLDVITKLFKNTVELEFEKRAVFELAFAEKNRDIIKYLIDTTSDISELGCWFLTSYIKTFDLNESEILYLKEHSYNFNYNGVDALNYFAQNGDIAKFKLLENHTDLSIAKKNRLMTRVIRSGQLEMVIYLLEKWPDVVLDDSAISHAAYSGNIPLVDFLLSKGCKLDSDENPIFNAARSGQLDIIPYLIARGCDALSENSKALVIACESGYKEVLKLLLTLGLNPKVNNNEPLIEASEFGHQEIVGNLLALGANPKSQKSLALVKAIEKGNFAVVKLLLEDGRWLLGSFKLCMQELSRSRFSDFRKICSDLLALYGFDPVDPSLDKDKFEELVDLSLNKGPKPYFSPESELIRSNILQNEIKSLLEENEVTSGSESSMDESLMKAARAHYDGIVKKDVNLNKLFIEKGGLLGVERLIREAILTKVIEYYKAEAVLHPQTVSLSSPSSSSSSGSSSSPNPNDILSFIELNKEALLSSSFTTDVSFDTVSDAASNVSADASSKDSIMNTFRELIKDENEAIAVIAWRAYDQKAQTVGFPNLLSSPAEELKNETVFSTAASTVSQGAVTQQSASDEIREMAAYYFLCVLDTEDGLDRFIQYVAEIRRAHNDEITGTDNPSCYPGCITRLIRIIANTKFKLDENVISVIKDEIRFKVVADFKKELELCTTLADKAELYDAITGLSAGYSSEQLNDKILMDIHNDASQINLPSGAIGYSAKLLSIRKNFVEKYFGLDPIKQKETILEQLSKKNIDIPTEASALIGPFVAQAFIDLTHNGALGSMVPDYNKAIGRKKDAVYNEDNNPYPLMTMEKCIDAAPGKSSVLAERAYVALQVKHKIFELIESTLLYNQIYTVGLAAQLTEAHYLVLKNELADIPSDSNQPNDSKIELCVAQLDKVMETAFNPKLASLTMKEYLDEDVQQFDSSIKRRNLPLEFDVEALTAKLEGVMRGITHQAAPSLAAPVGDMPIQANKALVFSDKLAPSKQDEAQYSPTEDKNNPSLPGIKP